MIKFLQIFNKLFSYIFGTFEEAEFQKFLVLGTVFSLIIGSYWTLGTVKESLLSNLIGSSMLPAAKIISLLLLIPIITCYSKLSDYIVRNHLFIYISLGYFLITLLFSLTIAHTVTSEALLQSHRSLLYYFLSFSFYAFVESYGSLVVALFWAICTDTTKPESAKKGFPLLVMFGQIGGILGPLFLCKVPRYCNLTTSSITVTISAFLILLSAIIIYYFFTTTPSYLLQSLDDQQEKNDRSDTSFFSGLREIFSNVYLISIFFILFFYEFITQLLDFEFKNKAITGITGVTLTEYFGYYGSMINLFTLVSLLMGINKITRFFGITISLFVVPVIIATAFLLFNTTHQATLFWVLIVAKALHFSLTVPSMKQLYIPTNHAIRYKAQTWIDAFGSRIARQLSSFYFIFLNSLHLSYNNYFSLLVIITWLFVIAINGILYKKKI